MKQNGQTPPTAIFHYILNVNIKIVTYDQRSYGQSVLIQFYMFIQMQMYLNKMK